MAIAPELTPTHALESLMVDSCSPLVIAEGRCKGCELCITACPQHVLDLDRAVVNRLGYHPVRLTDASGCTSCAICAKVCPDAVFTVYARPKEA